MERQARVAGDTVMTRVGESSSAGGYVVDTGAELAWCPLAPV